MRARKWKMRQVHACNGIMMYQVCSFRLCLIMDRSPLTV